MALKILKLVAVWLDNLLPCWEMLGTCWRFEGSVIEQAATIGLVPTSFLRRLALDVYEGMD